MASWEAEPFSVHTLRVQSTALVRIRAKHTSYLVCSDGTQQDSIEKRLCLVPLYAYAIVVGHYHVRIHSWAGPSRKHFADAWNRMRATAPSAGRTAFADTNALTSRCSAFVSFCRLRSTPCFCIQQSQASCIRHRLPCGCLFPARLCRIDFMKDPHACHPDRGHSSGEGSSCCAWCTCRRASLLRSALH